MNSLTINAPAKINLWLTVKGKRPDGYHEIESIMQTVTLFDTVTVTKNEGGAEKNIKITCSNPDVPCDERNLCYKAAVSFFSAAGITEYDISVHIEKRIPMAAGLAGGSTDGAAVFVALNSLYGSPFTEDELCALGGRLGADIPFCIRGGTCIAGGIGEKLTSCPPMPDCFIVIACGGEGVSTPWAYKMIDDSQTPTRHGDITELEKLLAAGDIYKAAAEMRNSFEDAILPHREVARKLKDAMIKGGAVRSMMSGSGPSVFGIFKDEEAAKKVCELISGEGYFAHVCTPYRGEK